jgi:hypothetical protein
MRQHDVEFLTMGLFSDRAKMEIVAASGGLRVGVQPSPSPALMGLEAVTTFAFAVFVFRQWPKLPLLFHILLPWAVIAAILAWFYQLSGSEVIEFDLQKLTIRRYVLGWERTREYAVENCSELDWRKQSSEDRYGLQCMCGWRTIRFAQYVSESQAIEILTALQKELPDVAQRMGVMELGKGHFIRLGLS